MLDRAPILTLPRQSLSMMMHRFEKTRGTITGRSYLAALEVNHALINEPSFRDQVTFWDEPCIDCTTHALDTKLGPDEVELAMRADRKAAFFESPKDVLDPQTTEALIARFRDDRTGLPRQSAHTFPDAASIDQAFRLVFQYTSYAIEDAEHKTEEQKTIEKGALIERQFSGLLQVCSNYLSACRTQSGMYAKTPKSTASVGSTFSTMMAFCFLDHHGLGALVPQECRDTYELLGDTLMTDYARRLDSKMGFANVMGGPPLLCATFYATRIITNLILTNQMWDKDKFRREIPPQDIVNFLGDCRRPGHALFAERGVSPNLINTR